MIARALAQETPIILLDEPTAFLDFHSRIDTLRLLSRLAHTMGKTILLSTHDLQLAAELADLLLLLSPDGLRPVIPLRSARISVSGSKIRWRASSPW